jgi:hypothetical protein
VSTTPTTLFGMYLILVLRGSVKLTNLFYNCYRFRYKYYLGKKTVVTIIHRLYTESHDDTRHHTMFSQTADYTTLGSLLLTLARRHASKLMNG